MTRTLYLTYGADYESYTPIAAFENEADAKALADACNDYQNSVSQPECPSADDPDAEWELHRIAFDGWRMAHPAGKAYHESEFGVDTLELRSPTAAEKP